MVIESKAGEGAHFKDRDFSEAGAEIVFQPEKVFDAEIILKVAPLSEEEISLLKMHQMRETAIVIGGNRSSVPARPHILGAARTAARATHTQPSAHSLNGFASQRHTAPLAAFAQDMRLAALQV